MPVWPYRWLQTAEGNAFPYYIIPFDKNGACEGPRTRQHLIDNAANYTDLFLFSHGWNNDWTVATERYEDGAVVFGSNQQRTSCHVADIRSRALARLVPRHGAAD